jgi:hypothetical protein
MPSSAAGGGGAAAAAAAGSRVTKRPAALASRWRRRGARRRGRRQRMLEFSSLGRASASMPARVLLPYHQRPTGGYKATYLHKVVNHTSHSVAKCAENQTKQNTATVLHCGAILRFTNVSMLSYCNFTLAEDEIFKLLLKLELQLDQNLNLQCLQRSITFFSFFFTFKRLVSQNPTGTFFCWFVTPLKPPVLLKHIKLFLRSGWAKSEPDA